MPKAGHKFRYSFPIIGSLVKRTYSIASSAQIQHMFSRRKTAMKPVWSWNIWERSFSADDVELHQWMLQTTWTCLIHLIPWKPMPLPTLNHSSRVTQCATRALTFLACAQTIVFSSFHLVELTTPDHWHESHHFPGIQWFIGVVQPWIQNSAKSDLSPSSQLGFQNHRTTEPTWAFPSLGEAWDVPHNWSMDWDINHHKLYLEACVYSQRTINNRPGGYSDLKPNVYFILAGPCGLQLHVCKEFDQIPFSKCLKPAFWVILFWYMHALLTNVFFSEHFHPKASLCNCRPVAWNKCFFWTHCHCHCCAYCISNGLAFGLCKTIFTRSTQTT